MKINKKKFMYVTSHTSYKGDLVLFDLLLFSLIQILEVLIQ